MRHHRYGDVQVDAVEQRPRDTCAIAFDRGVVAAAIGVAFAAPAARAGVHRRDQREARRKRARARCAGDRHGAVFERLP